MNSWQTNLYVRGSHISDSQLCRYISSHSDSEHMLTWRLLDSKCDQCLGVKPEE